MKLKQLNFYQNNYTKKININLHKLQNVIDQQTIKIRELNMIENEIFNANQCSEISEFIKNTQSELLYRNKENNNNYKMDITYHSRSIQVDDFERNNCISLSHSMKEYSNTLQIQLYQLKQY